MSFHFVPLRAADAPRFRPLLDDPALAREFDILVPPGQLEHSLEDHLAIPGACCLALDGEEPAGFSIGFALPQAGGVWKAVLRIGVATRFRRRGLGRLLLERGVAAFAGRPGPQPSSLEVAAWQPSPEGDAFAARHGFAHTRWFWRMTRVPGPAPRHEWPPGVTARVFDGSERMLQDWTDAYNDSFAEHWGFIPGEVEHSRHLAADPLFLADGLIVAYRDGAVAGFCRNEATGRTGVVGALGVSRSARGIGLGRALLRWGVAQLLGAGFEKVSLLVDGENETAQRLYRSEGFEVERTRRTWSRPFSDLRSESTLSATRDAAP